MKVQRYDIGTLAAPVETPQGFLKIEGHASRTGIFEYLRKDGSVRRELRLPQEVFKKKALDGYEGAPITNNHPSKKVTAKNAKNVSVGHVQGAARRDGDHVKVTTMVTDADTIKALRGGKRGLSTGYDVEMDETPGVHPEFGRYDAIQRDLEINHLAIVDFPRAGDSARLRMDSMDLGRDDALMVQGTQLTRSEEGHQHSVSTLSYSGDIKTSGSTSYALADGADAEHTHEWVMNDDGTITISENAGHTHDLEDMSMSDTSATKTDGRHPPKRSSQMPNPAKTEQKKDEGKKPTPAGGKKPSAEDINIAEAAVEELGKEKLRADEAEKALAAMTSRAHLAEGKVLGLQTKLDEAEADRTDSEVIAAKDLAIEDLTAERDDLQTKLDAASDPKRITAIVKDRVALEKSASKLLGEERLDALDDKDLMLAALEKCGRRDLADKDVNFVRGVFEHVVEGHEKNVKAIDKLRIIQRANKETAERTDAGDESARDRYLKRQNTAWKPKTGAAQKGSH